MTFGLAGLLSTVTTPTDHGLFRVRRVLGHSAYYVGRDAAGSAAILICASGAGRTVPLRLAGIEARFGVPCKVAEEGVPERTETLTVILCLSHEPGIESYFAGAAETILALLGDAPTVRGAEEAVERFVDLFQKLRTAPKRTLLGLVGELIVISAARDIAAAVSAWRVDPDERYDFVLGKLRLDAKSSANRQRTHGLSYEQANPPHDLVALLASVWVDAAAGGTSLSEHIAAIETRLAGNHSLLLRLRSVIADTLGETLPVALDWRFDLEVAMSSLAFYDMRTIPAIRPPLDHRLSMVRFVSDLDGARRVTLANMVTLLDHAALGLLPNA